MEIGCKVTNKKEYNQIYLAFSTVTFKGIERALYEFYFRQNYVGLCRLENILNPYLQRFFPAFYVGM